jgi:5-methylcytosine-specific restriction endonuclease McrA
MVWTDIGGYGQAMRTRQLRHQCQQCGQLVGSALRHSLATPDTPEVDSDALDRGIAAREAQWQEYGRAMKERRENERAEWQAWYAEYLQSDAWHERRRLVLRRAGGICEGCRSATAAQVHHLTYQNAGKEFLWELVAICRACHERYHEPAECRL